jgi:small subunit ribosomal protein S20
MPNIKSAKKRVKVIATKTLINKSASAELKTDIKKANLALEKTGTESAETVRFALKKIDQAAAKGILHKNTAARKKSALARKLNAAAKA